MTMSWYEKKNLMCVARKVQQHKFNVIALLVFYCSGSAGAKKGAVLK